MDEHKNETPETDTSTGFIRSLRSPKEKKKIAIITVSIFIMLLPFLLIIGFFTRPISSFLVNRTIQTYVAEHYAELDLTVGLTWWSLKGEGFDTHIYYRNNDEIFFRIFYTRQTGISDGYVNGDFWARYLRVTHLPHIEAHFGDTLRRFEASVRGLQVGEMPSQNVNLEVTARIRLFIENLEPASIAEKFLQAHEILQESDIPFTEYRIEFFAADRSHIATILLHARHINADLPALIAYLQDNLDENARYVDRENGASYWTGLGISPLCRTPVADYRIVRTNIHSPMWDHHRGEVYGADYPIVIRSMDELTAYLDYYSGIEIGFRGNHTPIYADEQLLDILLYPYTEDFFTEHFLVLFSREEPSGSIRHRLDRVDRSGNVHLVRILPEVGTADMAAWHIALAFEHSVSIEEFQLVIIDE